ncbi:MAG: hypothetical protein ACMUEK_01795 [Sodalis sp. (in: enterobacteria)]
MNSRVTTQERRSCIQKFCLQFRLFLVKGRLESDRCFGCVTQYNVGSPSFVLYG